MSGVVWSPIHVVSDDLYILDGEHRLYVGLSRDGSYLHVVSPAQVEQRDLESGEITRGVGQLACSCRGGVYHGRCYRVEAAEAFEAGDADRLAAPAWMRDIAPETELERAAARG